MPKPVPLSDMLKRLRKPMIGIGLAIGAMLVVAVLDGTFQTFFPFLSDLRVGHTNLATCVVIAELAAALLLAGYLGRRWHSALGWVLLPVVALYAAAVATAPDFYVCSPIRVLWGCTIVHMPFVIGIARF